MPFMPLMAGSEFKVPFLPIIKRKDRGETMAWNKEETISRSEMKDIQLARLKKTVGYIYDKNPVYKKKLVEAGVKPSDIKSLDDIRRLPFTTKQDIRDNYPFNLFTASQEDIVEYHATSGTTGKPVVVGYTRNDLESWSEVMARACTGAGFTKKDIVQNVFGYGLFTGGPGCDYGAIRIGAGGDSDLRRQYAETDHVMQDFGSTALTSTPSFLMHVHEVGIEMGLDFKKLNLRTGLFGAEPWSESMRHTIQEGFGITACDIYGLSEIIGPGVGFECHEARCGLHINEDYFYPEIINPETGEVLPYGEEGELVFTTIVNEGQPLLRYRTRDITRLNLEPCVCGRTLVKIERINGRTDDMLIIRGVNFFPSQIESIILKREGISPHYMIVVERKGSMDNVDVKMR